MSNILGNISLQRKIDIAQVLKYPLIPVTLSWSHLGGTMLSSPKSVILIYLKTKGAMKTLDEIDVQITDAAFFFCTITRISQLILAM